MNNKEQEHLLKNEEVLPCQGIHISGEDIKKLSLDPEEAIGVANIFKALADDTRVKIVYALLEAGDLCVCDIADIAGVSTATASHHLRLLFNMRLAKSSKRGKYVHYTLDDNHVKELLAQASAHWRHSK